MGLFKKNPNEVAFIGGNKHWADVIKNTSVGGDLIWKQPEEDFNTNSTLIVKPGEEAIFLNGGVVEEVFSNGTFKLSTQNYPFISRLRNAFTGGISTFNCVVYFVRTASSIEIKSGTDTPIQIRDKMLGIQTDLRVRWAYKVQVGNASKFLTKMIGNNINRFSPEDVEDYFNGETTSDIKSIIAEYVKKSDDEILGITSDLRKLSNEIEPIVAASMEEYGMKLLRFSITGIDIDKDENRQRFDNYNIDATGKIRNAQADREVMNLLGSNWQAQQQVDIMKKLAEQQGGSAIGAQMGLGMATAGAFFGMGQQMMQQQMPQSGSMPPPLAQFHVYIGGQQIGPMSVNDISGLLQSGQMDRSTLVWRQGMANWAPAGSVPDLAHFFASPTMPPPPPPGKI